jgi:hypothetical protein
MKTKNEYKITHGAIIDETTSELEECFKPKQKTSTAESKNLEKMSLPELQAIAEDLGLVPSDNKSLLVKAIKRELKK